MHRANHFQLHKALGLLLSLSLILTAVFGGTLAQIITKTPSFINTFLSGLDPTGDLVIRKEVTHPFGDSYAIPAGLSFDFTVSLGASYAGKTVETSQGEIIADENGNITVSVAPDEAIRINDLMDGTSVTVKEAAANGFTPAGGVEKSVTIQSGDNEITYTNAYAPGPVSPVNLTVSGTKLLEGRDWQEGDSFTFQLEYKLAGEAQWQKLGEASVTYELVEVTDPETGAVTLEPKPDFDKLEFTELVQGVTYASAGEYSFRVSEVEGTVGGITYDKVVSYFDVLVGDADMNGSLEIQNVSGYQNAAASYNASTNQYHVDVTVNNKYAPAGTATAVIHIDKHVMSLSGEDKPAAGYTFELYDESGSLVATSRETSAAGETTIELIYDAKDAGTTFHYTLKETHSGETHNGMVYADTVYPISVSIVDNMDGTVSAYVYNSAEYQTELIEVEPEETEPEETEPEETEPEETEPEQTEPEQTEPEQTEPEQTEPEQTEPEQTEPEQTEPEQTEPVQTEPVQPEPMQIEPVRTEPVQTQPQETETAETTPATTSELVVEIVTEPVPLSSGLDATDTTEETQARSLASAPPENIDGSEPSDPLANTDTPTENIDVPTETTDTPAEDPTDPPVSNSSINNETDTPVEPVTTSETKEVAVIPEGASNTYSVSFVNVYDPADTQASFDGSKELTGRSLNEGEFSFDLYATGDSFTVTEGMEPVQSVTNNADGSFVFAAIGYDKVGTYRYVVKEDPSANLGGVTYDDSVFHVIVSVTDENGALIASTAITDELGTAAEIKFQNSYKATATSVTFTGTKTLTGMDLAADMFQFHLYQADESYTAQGAALAGASNDAAGNFSFESITYSDPGTFYYVVKEDASAGVKGMTYDDTAYGIKVSVWDDGSGTLKASYTITVVGGSEVDAILFENSYTKPVDPTDPPKPTDPTDPTDPPEPTDPSDPTDPPTPTDPPMPTDPTKPTKPADPNTPATGDTSNIGLYAAIMLASLAAIIVLLIFSKRQKKGGKYLR